MEASTAQVQASAQATGFGTAEDRENGIVCGADEGCMVPAKSDGTIAFDTVVDSRIKAESTLNDLPYIPDKPCRPKRPEK
jgi:hypothetical protein